MKYGIVLLKGGVRMRKTHTSSEVKNRYNEKAYGRIYVLLPKELVAKFKEECKRRDVSQASVVRQAIEDFLKEE